MCMRTISEEDKVFTCVCKKKFLLLCLLFCIDDNVET